MRLFMGVVALLTVGTLATGCDPTFPSLGGVYVRTGALITSQPEQVAQIEGAVGFRFPDQLVVHQYSFEERPYGQLPNGKAGPENAWQIAQPLEVGTPDVGASGSLFHRAAIQPEGWAANELLIANIADTVSDPMFSDEGFEMGPSCLFNYTVTGTLGFTPSADELTRGETGIYRRTFLPLGSDFSRGWIWSDIQTAIWNPDATQAVLAVRLNKTLAFNSLRTCLYNGRSYPQTVESITLAFFYKRQEVFASEDLRKQIDRNKIMAQAESYYPTAVDAWKVAFDIKNSAQSVNKFFGPTRFPEE